MAGDDRKQPIKQPTEISTSTMALMGRCPSLMGRFAHFKNEKSARRGSFWDGYPADIRGPFARISRPKTSVRAVKILEKNKYFGADIHDPKARTSTTLRGFQKLRQRNFGLTFSCLPFRLGDLAPSTRKSLAIAIVLRMRATKEPQK